MRGMGRAFWGMVVLSVGIMGGTVGANADIIIPPVQPSRWVIESAEYTGEVHDLIARLEARYTIKVMQDGWVEIPLTLQGAKVTEIILEKKVGEAQVAPRGTTYVLVANRKGVYKVRVKCAAMLVQDSQFEGVQLAIPQATFSSMALFVPRQDVELRVQDQLYVDRKADAARGGVLLTAKVGSSDAIDLRWRTKPVTPAHIEPAVFGEVGTLVTIEEQLARLLTVIDYRMTQGEIKELRVHVPSTLNVLNVRGAGIEDWHLKELADGKMLIVALTFPLKDTTYRLVVEGEQSIEAQHDEILLPEIQLDGVKQERGYVAVARSGNIELSPKTLEGMNRVDVKELPQFLVSGGATSASLAFRYHQHPYQVVLALTRHNDHPVLAAIAEQGELVTVISRQGELMTRALYLIKANKKQFLTVTLPNDGELWSCIVDGTSVKPAKGTDNALLIPLPATTNGAQAITVELVYFEHRPELTHIGHLQLQGPTLDMPSTVSNWSVYAPHDIKFLRVGGNLDRGAANYAFLDDPFSTPATFPMTGGRNGELNGSPSGQTQRQQFFAKRGLVYAMKAVDQVRQHRDDGSFARSSPEDSRHAGFGTAYEQPAATPPADEDKKETLGGELETLRALQETGILPLKIRLPKAGTVYHFNRLMTTQDALRLDATFVHLPMPWIPFGVFGLVLLPIGGVVVTRIARR